MFSIHWERREMVGYFKWTAHSVCISRLLSGSTVADVKEIPSLCDNTLIIS